MSVQSSMLLITLLPCSMLDFLNTHFAAFTAVIKSFFFSFWLFATRTKRRKWTATIAARAVTVVVVAVVVVAVEGILGFDSMKATEDEEGD